MSSSTERRVPGGRAVPPSSSRSQRRWTSRWGGAPPSGAALGRVEVVVDRVVVGPPARCPSQVATMVWSPAHLAPGRDQVGGDEDTLAREVALVVEAATSTSTRSAGRGWPVRGQGPGRGRPDERQFGARRILARSRGAGSPSPCCRCGLLNLVVHLEFVVTQRRAVVPAVRRNAGNCW